MASEEVWRTEFIFCVGHSLPDSKSGDQYEANNERGYDCDIGARFIGCTDNANQCKDNSGHDKRSANIVQSFDGFVPWDTFWMLGRFVERPDRGQREELCDEARPVDELPCVYINRILGMLLVTYFEGVFYATPRYVLCQRLGR